MPETVTDGLFELFESFEEPCILARDGQWYIAIYYTKNIGYHVVIRNNDKCTARYKLTREGVLNFVTGTLNKLKRNPNHSMLVDVTLETRFGIGEKKKIYE